MEKILDFCESKIALIIGGVFLCLSLVLSALGVDAPVFLDPAWIPAIISGIPLVASAIKKLRKNKGIAKISSALLISIAMFAAIFIGDIFAAGEVAFIMAIGELLEDMTTAKAKKGLKKLIELAPTKARLIVNGEERIVSPESVSEGDVLRILPGEIIPVDARILKGETTVDQSVITGESLPVDKGVGDSVYCGTINRFGAIDVVATRVGEDSSLQKLIKMVRDAEDNKAPMQRTADKWASILVPVALAIAVIAGLIKSNIVVAVTVLVVFCPCALVLATPTAIMAAIGQATKKGIIIKSGEALEKMSRIKTVAFDKTGTLTYGNLTVSEIFSTRDGLSEDNVLSLIASAEKKSEHPLGKAVVKCAEDKNVMTFECEGFLADAGKGISCKINSKLLLCGNESFVVEKGASLTSDCVEILEKARNEGKACIIAMIEKEVIGIVTLSDSLREQSKATIDELLSLGVSSVLLTGDNKRAAEYFSKNAGIKDVCAELLPEEKVKCINDIKKSGEEVCMVGDGINDAPALKTADVGIAMGTMGSDIAVEASDIALMGDDISKIPYLKRLSLETVKTIKFSISLSLFINFLAIVLSFFELLTPTTGALVHNAGSVFVIFIAALLYDRKI